MDHCNRCRRSINNLSKCALTAALVLSQADALCRDFDRGGPLAIGRRSPATRTMGRISHRGDGAAATMWSSSATVSGGRIARANRRPRPPPLLARALNARGGGAGGDGDGLRLEGEADIDENDADVETGDNEDNDSERGGGGEDAMREIRKRWSAESPATPSIAWPVAEETTMAPTEGTLGELDRANGRRISERTKALIIVDGFSPYHSQYLSHTARRAHGAAVVHVLSDFMARYLYQAQGETDHLSSRMPDLDSEEDVEAWARQLPPSLDIRGIYCESDSGLEDAERLGVALDLYPCCHDGINSARRDKFLMNRMVSEVGGLDTVRQRSCRTLEDAEEFAADLGLGEIGEDDGDGGGALVIVKPPRGVASDDVHLCADLPSLREAFSKILQSPVFGSSVAAKHRTVLLQEFAPGVEYAADIVCRDGERKVAALWRYDKRAVNGAPFVYHATELVSATAASGEEEREVCDYALAALKALGIRWGLSHVEVIAGMPSAGPSGGPSGRRRVRLVEVNCRQHNTDFAPLTNACVGYNALDMVLAAHLGDAPGLDQGRGALRWSSVPALPSLRARGAVVHFVSHVEGTISRICHDVLEEMEELPSVVDMLVYPQFLEVGNPIEKTVDIRSDTGWAHLMNDDEGQFRGDYERLIELMKEMFEVEENRERE